MLRIICCFLAIPAIMIGIMFMKVNLWDSPYEGNIESVRGIVLQLSEKLIQLTAKQCQLQNEFSRLSEACFLPDDADTESLKNDVSPKRKHHYEDSYDRMKTDFALESAGARIIDTGGTIEHVLHDSRVSRVLYTISSVLCRGCDGARIMLQPGSLPGECWAFKGSRGEAVIQLLGKINVTGVALEHIPAKISPTGDISSAPRHFQLEGLDDTYSGRSHNFGKFEYDRHGKTIQYFDVIFPVKRHFHIVKVRFLSNWGHPEYTCVYRVRVHGHLAPGQTYIDADFDGQLIVRDNT